MIQRKKHFQNCSHAHTKLCRRLARLDKICSVDQQRLRRTFFERRGGRRKPSEAVEPIAQTWCEERWRVQDELAVQKPQTGLEEHMHRSANCSDPNAMRERHEVAKCIEEPQALEEHLMARIKDDEHCIPSAANNQSAVVLQVTTLSGLTLSRRNVFPDSMVLELKQSLAPHVGVPPSHQRLLHGSTLLDDAHTLQEYDLSSQLAAARCCGGMPVQFSLVTFSDPVVTVPDDYGSVSEAVASLPQAGGMVQLVGPPLVSGDVIEIRSPNISIIAVSRGGVDVRQAKLYIKNSYSESETPVRIHGLKNLCRVVVFGCGRSGSIAFRDCDLLPAKELHVHARAGPGDSGGTIRNTRTLIYCRSLCGAPFGWRKPSLKCGAYKNGKDASRTVYLDYSKSTLGVPHIPWPACSAPLSVPKSMRSILQGVWKFKCRTLERTMQSDHSPRGAEWPCLASAAAL